MAKAGFGTAKYQAKQLKASGLQKLRYYCQLCQKQCRDANGFKNHLNSPSHLGRISNIADNGASGRTIAEFLAQFERDFLRLLRINHGTKKVSANKYYQEYILNDKDHVHMNATRWSSLTAFVKYLGTTGKVRVDMPPDEEEFNLYIKYVDSLVDSRQDRDRNLKSDEDLSMKFLKSQIAAGNEPAGNETNDAAAPQEVTESPKALAPAVSLSLKGLKPKRGPVKSVFADDDA